MWIMRAGLLLSLAGASLWASMSFSAPACGGQISGTAALTVMANSGSLARVEFAIGSNRIGVASRPPFTANWNTAEAMDGVSDIQARGFDALGNQVEAAACEVTISNRQAYLKVTAPDLNQPLSGTVSVMVTGADALAFPAVWMLNIDGEEQSTVWTDNTWKSPLNVTFSLDTTRFSNGPHELHISMNSRTGPAQPQWVNWRGMVNRLVSFNNGHAVMDVITGMQSLYLSPGQEAPVGCTQLYTDGVSSACGHVSYQTSDPVVASVDANGIVTAGQKGFALVTVTDGSRSCTSRVQVDNVAGVPHFLGDGTMTRAYQAGKSLFVIAPFFLDPPSIAQNSGLLESATLAGVNTLSFGVYSNPRNTATAFTDWKAGFDQNVVPRMTWAKQNGFHLLLTGDDIFRNIGTDAWYTLNWPNGKQAVKYAVGALASTGVGIGIEAIDEASSIWGDRPVPKGNIGQADYLFNKIECTAGSCAVEWLQNPLPNGWPFALRGSSTAALNSRAGSLFTATGGTGDGFQFSASGPVSGSFSAATDPGIEYLWFAGNYCKGSPCNPVVPNNALAVMRSWMTATPSSTPIAFPPLATSPATVHGAWMGPGSVSDYASQYFTSLKTRATYPWSEGIQEMVSSVESEFNSREPYLMLDRPQLMLVSLSGPSYTKQNRTGSTYEPGVDSLDQPGVNPSHVSALMMTSAALGGAGIRLYYFEPPSDLAFRAQAAPGTYMQTGSNPSNLQSDSWKAMGSSANLLTHVLEPYLLGAARSSPAYGRNIVTAVRQSAAGLMLLVVNGNDWTRSIPVDLRPFGGAGSVARYRLRASSIGTDLLPRAQTIDKIDLEAGESVVYIIPNQASAMPLQTVNIPLQPSDGQVAGIRYGYLYQENVDSGATVACTKTCKVFRDPQLGPLYYRVLKENSSSPGATRTLN